MPFKQYIYIKSFYRFDNLIQLEISVHGLVVMQHDVNLR